MLAIANRNIKCNPRRMLVMSGVCESNWGEEVRRATS